MIQNTYTTLIIYPTFIIPDMCHIRTMHHAGRTMYCIRLDFRLYWQKSYFACRNMQTKRQLFFTWFVSNPEFLSNIFTHYANIPEQFVFNQYLASRCEFCVICDIHPFSKLCKKSSRLFTTIWNKQVSGELLHPCKLRAMQTLYGSARQMSALHA